MTRIPRYNFPFSYYNFYKHYPMQEQYPPPINNYNNSFNKNNIHKKAQNINNLDNNS